MLALHRLGLTETLTSPGRLVEVGYVFLFERIGAKQLRLERACVDLRQFLLMLLSLLWVILITVLLIRVCAHIINMLTIPRGGKILWICAMELLKMLISSVLPPMGASDYSLVYLRPVYQRLLEREKPQENSFKEWDNDSIMALQGCVECT